VKQERIIYTWKGESALPCRGTMFFREKRGRGKRAKLVEEVPRDIEARRGGVFQRPNIPRSARHGDRR